MEVHIPEPEEGYNFDKAKKENPETRWRLLFFLVVLAVVVAGLVMNGFSFDFSDHVPVQDDLMLNNYLDELEI